MTTEHNKDMVTEMNFSGLILGFCSAALSYLGYGDAQAEKNLTLAKQNIDILEILSLKTKGNLNADEERLIQQVLKDLRMKFVEAAK